MADYFKMSPSMLRSWPLADIMLMQRFFKKRNAQAEQAGATDSPEVMAKKFGKSPTSGVKRR
jgi:hypothetical protein